MGERVQISSNRGAHVNQLSNRPQRITTRQVDPSSYISHPTSAAGGHSRLGWLTRDQHSHSIEVIAFQKLVLGSTALHFLPSVSISAAPSLLLPASFGWASLCMTSQAPARAVARTVKSWAIHGQLYQVRATITALFLKIVERSM